MLRSHDFFFYPEGGRSYSGEMKTPKTGLMHAVLQAEHSHVSIIPTAVAYDVVLEDHVLARQGVKRVQRAVQPRTGRDGALRGRLQVARLRHVRQADVGQGHRPRVAPRGARPQP